MMLKHRKSRYGFTLAETLITLGIIGIVAAMTLPSVIGNAQKSATAAKVHKFYNTINTALQFAIAEYGDVSNWIGEAKVLTYEENLEFFNMYFGKHIKYNRYDNCYGNAVCIYMETGGILMFKYEGNGADFFYFVNGKQKGGSRNAFSFQINKIGGQDEDGNIITREVNTTVEPYTYEWDGTYEKLTTHSFRGCKKEAYSYGNFCCKILQLNNWQFPKDYPW